jgi:uncharacterized protein (TIGR02996 family)
MNPQWHHRREGRTKGPYSLTELRRLALAGELGPADRVRKAGMPTWIAAAAVAKLFAPRRVEAPLVRAYTALDAAFLRAILENPDSDAPRLIYADWLDEQGDTRGEFIRLQCRLAQLAPRDLLRATAAARAVTIRTGQSPPSEPAAALLPGLKARQQQLLAAHAGSWVDSLRGVECTWHFRRGFVAAVEIDAAELLAKAHVLFDAAPVQHVVLCNAAGHVPALAAMPSLARLNSLDLFGNRITDEDVAVLVRSPHVSGLKALGLGGNRLGNTSAAELARSPYLSRLTELDLNYNRINGSGVEALAASPHLTRLETLTFCGTRIRRRGALALARSANLARLTVVDLRVYYGWSKLGQEGRTALRARFGKGVSMRTMRVRGA